MSVSLGLGPKKPKQRGWNPVPPLRRYRPQVSPPMSLPHPQTLPWSRGVMMGQERSKSWAWGREWRRCGGDCCCPGQARREGGP